MAKRRPNRSISAARAARIENRYDAAGTGRRFAGWNTPSSGPNTAIAGLQKMRDRARDVTRNEWSGAASVRVWTSNTIGTGIMPRFSGLPRDRKTALSKLWNAWCAVADADQVLDFYGLEMLAARSWFMSGEVFGRIRPRRIEDGLVVPMQVQLLEADMVPIFDADTYTGLAKGSVIRQGIELDYIGRKTAYWMYRNHPGDKLLLAMPDAGLLVRVPVSQVFHVFDPQRPGQLRGVPEMASVIGKLKNVGDFDDAVLERQRLANLFTLFVIKPIPSGANDPMTGLPYKGTADEPIAGLEPGISQELLPGEDVRFSDPPDAGATYADFMREQMLGVAAGGGTPYELMAGDIKDVSDRTLRIVINEFRRVCEQRQWLLFIPQMCQKVLGAWVDFAALAGHIPMSEIEDAKAVTWAPQGWAYIHPVQDVQAKQAEVEAGFRSRSSVIVERGDDPELVDDERAEDNKREKALDLLPPAPSPAPVKDDDPAEKDAKKVENALLSRVMAMLDYEGATNG